MNIANKKTLYCRVSTELQEFDSQRQIVSDYLERINADFTIEDLDIVEEKLSGDTDMNMRALQTLIDNSKQGDTIYVSMLTRFSRNAITGMYALYECYQKGVTVIDCSRGEEIDISDHNNKVTLFVQLWSAECELSRIRTASKAGTKKAKKEGVLYGRSNPNYIEDKEKNEQRKLNSAKTKVFNRLNNAQLRLIIRAVETVLPEIAEYSLSKDNNEHTHPFLGYNRYGKFTEEQWESIHRTYIAISNSSNNPSVNKEASIEELQYMYTYLWKPRFVAVAEKFIKYF